MEPEANSRRCNGVWIVLFATLAVAVVAMACHPWHHHVDGVHAELDLENWCVQMHTEQITDDTARQALEEVIESNALGWESRDTINFFGAGSIECSESVDPSNYEIEIHIWDDVVVDGDCTAPAVACTRMITIVSTHGEDTDYSKVRMHLAADQVEAGGAKWRFLVNHETGHVVGLADPTPTPDVVDYTAEHCLVWQEADFLGSFLYAVPVASIMHDRYCPQVSPGWDVEWPTMFDFISFDENVK